MEVTVRLLMYGDDVGASSVVTDPACRIFNHEMDVKEFLCVSPQLLDHHGPDGEIGDEVAVHDVHVDQSAPAFSMARISSPNLEKSAERIDGAMSLRLGRGLEELELVFLPWRP